MSKLVYVVAPTEDAFLKYIAKQWDGPLKDTGVRLVYVAPGQKVPTPPGGRAEFLFLRHWQSRKDWRYLYNRALSLRAGRP